MKRANRFGKRLLAAVLCLLMVLASVPAMPEEYAAVVGGKLNLREKATKYSRSLGHYKTGTRVQILDEGSTWSKVSVDGKTGYMMKKYLRPITRRTMYVRTDTGVPLHLREKPTIFSDILASYKPGTPVTVLKKGSAWCYVTIDGLKGYMGSQYLVSEY